MSHQLRRVTWSIVKLEIDFLGINAFTADLSENNSNPTGVTVCNMMDYILLNLTVSSLRSINLTEIDDTFTLQNLTNKFTTDLDVFILKWKTILDYTTLFLRSDISWNSNLFRRSTYFNKNISDFISGSWNTENQSRVICI